MTYPPTPVMGARVYWIRNAKGGVGKSTGAASIHYLRRKMGEESAIIDTDPANPDLFKSHAKSAIAHCVSLDSEDGYTNLAGLIARTDEDIVISAPAGGQELFERYAPVVDLVCRKCHRIVYLVWFIDPDIDSFINLEDSAAAVPYANVWVIRNLVFGPPEKFEAFNEHRVAQPIFKAGRVLDLPLVPAAVMRSFKSGRMSFNEILENGPEETRSALEIWTPRAMHALHPMLGEYRAAL